MPLAFESLSHGTVAFGFFNIAVDLLLLQDRFFLDAAFCEAVLALDRDGEARLPGWRIADPAAIGDLHGAIAGLALTGFIGATYRRFPFPADPAGFRQDPDAGRNDAWAAEAIASYGEAATIALAWDRPSGRVRVGELIFDRPGFAALLRYVDRGGYPRWRDGRRPAHVQRLVGTLAARGSALWTAAPSPG